MQVVREKQAFISGHSKDTFNKHYNRQAAQDAQRACQALQSPSKDTRAPLQKEGLSECSSKDRAERLNELLAMQRREVLEREERRKEELKLGFNQPVHLKSKEKFIKAPETQYIPYSNTDVFGQLLVFFSA